MKITKKTKILLIIASVMLLVCATLGIAASATETEENYTYDIPLINISHGASSSMLFAVDASIDAAESGEVVVTYTYYVGGEQKSAVAKYSEEITEYANLGMPVFYTVGISPKDQGEEITVEAHKASAPIDFEPNVYTTSIGKYLYSKLYRDGLIYSENADDVRLAKMYLAQIEYVSTCQDALWNADHEADARTLLNTYKYVCVSEGVLAGTVATSALVLDDVITLSYTGTDSANLGWNVKYIDDSGNVVTDVVIGNVIPLTGSVAITPYSDPNLITFESFTAGDVFEKDSRDIVIYKQNDIQRLWGGNTSATATIVKNRYDSNGVLITGFMWLYPVVNEGSNLAVLDMDVDCQKLVAGKGEKLYFRTGSPQPFTIEWRYYDSTTGMVIKVTDNLNGSNTTGWIPMGIDLDDTTPYFNLKIEYLWSTGALKISVNNNTVINKTVSSENAVNRVNMEANVNNIIIYDNISQYNIYVDPDKFGAQ